MKLKKKTLENIKSWEETPVYVFFKEHDFHKDTATVINTILGKTPIFSDKEIIDMWKDLDKYFRDKEFSNKLKGLVNEDK